MTLSRSPPPRPARRSARNRHGNDGQIGQDRLEKRGEIYLDAETDFRDPNNFAVVISKAGAASLKESGIADPAAHFMDQKIRPAGRSSSCKTFRGST